MGTSPLIEQPGHEGSERERCRGADPTEAARARAKALADLLWHIGAFVIVNGLFWFIDLTLGDGGADWAFWITAVWGLALAFHVLAYLIAGRRLVERKTQQYLDEETGR